MIYKIVIEKSALKYIKKQNKQEQERILKAIYKLPDGDTKPVQGHKEFYRLRVGDCRIIYNTSKTKALFEINKGVHSGDRRYGVKVNTRIPEEFRRVHFVNMIYIADGPSDIPAFSVVNKNNGATFAIYPRGDMDAMKQVEQMRVDGRVNMYAEADYTENTTAYMWICNKITEFAERIRKDEREKIAKYAAISTPKHLV